MLYFISSVILFEAFFLQQAAISLRNACNFKRMSLIRPTLHRISNGIEDAEEIVFKSIAKRYLSSKFQQCSSDGSECKSVRGINEVSFLHLPSQ